MFYFLKNWNFIKMFLQNFEWMKSFLKNISLDKVWIFRFFNFFLKKKKKNEKNVTGNRLCLPELLTHEIFF